MYIRDDEEMSVMGEKLRSCLLSRASRDQKNHPCSKKIKPLERNSDHVFYLEHPETNETILVLKKIKPFY